MGIFRYDLDSSRGKFTCPGCGKSGKFSRYVDRTTGEVVLDEDWGKCDRIDSCGYYEQAPVEFINDGDSVVHVESEKNLLESDKYREDYYEIFRNGKIPNNFLRGIMKRFGREAALEVREKYQIGTFLGGETIFPYYFDGEIRTGKVIAYKDDLHRDKNGRTFWLHNYGKYGYKSKTGTIHFPYVEPTGNYVTPFFGWDVIKANKKNPIAVVEAEKTAVICSIVFPEFNWIATGGLHMLQPYRFFFYSSNKWLFFPDLNGYEVWQKKLDLITTTFVINDFIIDYIPPNISDDERAVGKADGLDIADFILAGGNEYIDYMRDVLKKFMVVN